MDARLQRRVQRYGWDKAAACYEQFWATQLEPAQARLLEMAELAPGERAVDIACGTGLVTFRAVQQVGPQGSVIATDISEVMVDRIRAEAERRGMSRVTAERFDAEELGIASASCDVALCALGLMYVADPIVALREMRRIVRPGGRAALAVWGAREQCGWAEIFPIVERRVASEVCPLFFQLGNRDALRYALDAAGWIDIAIERLRTTLEYDSPDAACGAAFAGGPVALAYSRFDAVTRADAHAEYLASIADFRRDVLVCHSGRVRARHGEKGPRLALVEKRHFVASLSRSRACVRKTIGKLSHQARKALRRMRRLPTLVAASWRQANLISLVARDQPLEARVAVERREVRVDPERRGRQLARSTQ